MAIPLATVVVGILVIRSSETVDRQSTNVGVAMVVVVALLMALVWLVAFSRLSMRKRFRVLGVGLLGAAASGGLFFSVFRISGVTGDLVPIFQRRPWCGGPEPRKGIGLPPRQETQPAEAPAKAKDVPGLEDFPGLEDYPQFFGPHRDGKLSRPRLRTDWVESPPEEVWRRDVGPAWSGFAVSGRRAITQEQDGEEEAVVCYDVVTGAVLWVHRDRVRFEHPVAGVGPRATPTVDRDGEGRVFVQGATGILSCLQLATGRPLWSTNVVTENRAALPEWGMAGSPLVFDDSVVVSAGGKDGRSLVAYDKATGRVRWHGGSALNHWSSPIRGTLAGRDQILIFNALDVSGHDVRTGAILWTYPWRGKHPHVCMPVLCGEDRVLISSGYGTGCHLIRVESAGGEGFRTTPIFKSLSLKAKFANAIESDGFVFGLDDGILACVDLSTGRRRWKKGRYGHGQLILVAGVLLLTTEHGEVVLVEASPQAHRELARIEVFDDKTWNPPALAGRYLLVRNHREAVCYRLAIEN